MKIKVVITVFIMVVVLLIITLIPTETSQKESINKSVMELDGKVELIYDVYTDQKSIAKGTNTLDFFHDLEDKQERILFDKATEERYALIAKQVEAKRIAEEKRIAEAKRIAAEKKKAELAAKKLAQEKAAEKKRLAALEVKRVAKQKEKESKAKTASKEKVVVSRSSNYQSNYEVTFYTAFCDTGCTGVTASGYNVANTIYYQGLRIVAAPPNIPLGTKLRITFSNGNTMDAIALDRGGAIQGKILDILVSSTQEARSMGRQQVKVEILR